MTFNFVPGDRIQYPPSVLHQDIIVTGLGENWFLGRREGYREEAFLKEPDSGISWEAYKPPAKHWDITTEQRVPTTGDRYISGGVIYVGLLSHKEVKDVIVKIKEVK